jgi:hypothetical protein
MKVFALTAATLILAALSGATVTQASSPAQRSAAQAQTKALANLKFQLETRRKNENAAKSQKEAVTLAKAKAEVLTKINVTAEVQRRTQAAEQAAKVNAQIVSTAHSQMAPLSTKPITHINPANPVTAVTGHQPAQPHTGKGRAPAGHGK